MKKLLTSIAIIASVALIALSITNAFFSDTETSKGNTLLAGELDLEIDNKSYYRGEESTDTSWDLSNLTNQLFFDFDDIKPDDWGEDTISFHAENDYWLCMDMEVTKDDDNTCTEPEKLDDVNCDVPDPEPNQNLFDGELGGLVNFVWWADDGDNVLEDNETPFINVSPALTALNQSVALSDATNNVWGPLGPLSPESTYYIGKAWCFGNLATLPLTQDGVGNARTPAGDNNTNNTPGEPEDGGFTCDGLSLNNASQSDILMGDIEFRAYQARNNSGFTCTGDVISPTPTATPTPRACGQADVMLVLDRSGSINSTELGQLKTAANAFIGDLALTPLGNHAGMSSFATSATLNVHLTDTAADVTAAINALVSGGFTNLKGGIDLATGELDDTHIPHERPADPDYMIIITDGHPNRPLPSNTAPAAAKASADAARAASIKVYVVGVGSDVNTAYLQTIADAGKYYPVTDYSGLRTVLQSINICNP